MTKTEKLVEEMVAAFERVATVARHHTERRWVDSIGAAIIVGVSRRTFLERVACRDDFPVPARPTGPTGQPVWKAAEVDAWMERRRDAA